MRILAIDTALEVCAAAVLDAATGAMPAAESLDMARGHAEALMPLIARVMDAAQWEFAELDRIAVTVGPGSFTGLRVGIAAARGIALAADRPAVGLSTLSALAAPHVAARTQEIIITAINARNDNVYFQVFAPNGTTVVTPRLDHASNAVLAAVAEPTLITGSGAMLLAAHWPSALPMPRLDIRAAPDIGWVARLGAAAGAENASPKPLYLRRPDARPQDGGRLPRR